MFLQAATHALIFIPLLQYLSITLLPNKSFHYTGTVSTVVPVPPGVGVDFSYLFIPTKVGQCDLPHIVVSSVKKGAPPLSATKATAAATILSKPATDV